VTPRTAILTTKNKKSVSKIRRRNRKGRKKRIAKDLSPLVQSAESSRRIRHPIKLPLRRRLQTSSRAPKRTLQKMIYFAIRTTSPRSSTSRI
jgi:hypothetical protein